jgi:hypothetical protein
MKVKCVGSRACPQPPIRDRRFASDFPNRNPVMIAASNPPITGDRIKDDINV